MAFSNTYGTFASQQVEQLIRQAYMLIGKPSANLSALELQTAQNSMNFLLSEWINKGLNLWTMDISMVSLIPGQRFYPTPVGTINTVTVTANTTTRELGGTPFSSAGGTASNAFDGNPATACTQTAPDGYIYYDYGTNYANWNSINYVGVQPNDTSQYNLVIEYSFDTINWILADQPSLQLQTYTYSPLGAITWFVLYSPPLARAWRIRETGGATLNVQEIYFNTPNITRTLSPVSNSTYMNIPNKTLSNTISSYWTFRKIVPIITLWQSPPFPPNSSYDSIIYTRTRYIQDVTDFVQNAEVPQQYYGALVTGLAADLALMNAPEKYEILIKAAELKYNQAAGNNTESVRVSFAPDQFSNLGM